jgi:beta-mannosidase
MFRSWRVDVSGQLKEKANELHIVFTSPILKNDSIARANVKLPGGSDTSEYPVWPYTRKAAYHFGWDWAPRFVTSGIWKDINLKSWSNYVVRDVFYQTNALDENSAFLTAWIAIQADQKQIIDALVNEDTIQIELKKGNNYHQEHIHIDNPNLWWPNGRGEPYMYKYEFGIIHSTDSMVENNVQNVGLRTVELINEPDRIGTAFFFKVNGQPIFMKGANYVPQDVFLPRVKPEQYERLLTQVKNAGMNMLRVWGGGVYERDIFYDLCDEYGILVWQDFMFANTIYPNDKKLLDNIALEVAEQVNRLNKHACLALWCGNNEIKVAMTHWGWPVQYDYKEKEYFEFYSNYHFIFNRLLPSIIAKQSSRIPYVSTSPQSNWGTPENFNHGSMHYWGVWHGDDDFSGFNQNVGRFMVEWGFQSYPDYELLTQYLSPKHLSLESEVMQNRQKSYVGNGKILEFLRYYATYGGDPSVLSFRDFVYNSQWVQALGYEQAVEAHLAKQPHCMGTLLWQLNDCWPGPSWSIINYNGKPKQAYGKVKKHFTN